jgi:hypothetical protein
LFCHISSLFIVQTEYLALYHPNTRDREKGIKQAKGANPEELAPKVEEKAGPKRIMLADIPGGLPLQGCDPRS